MEFGRALKSLRKELGVTQVELANVLHINSVTVSRWEMGKATPNRSTTTALMDYARAHSVSKHCRETLEQSIAGAVKQKLEVSDSHIAAMDQPALCQLINDASFPLYVCDIKTDELLYINHKAEELLGGRLDQLPSRKCYVNLMHRDTPCEFCHKEQLTADEYTTFSAFRSDDQTYYRVRGKLITWKGRKAHVRFILDMAASINITAQKEREISYREQLRIRREHVIDAVAAAHYNLTHNTVTGVTSKDKALATFLSSHSIDEILAVLRDNPYSDDEQIKLDSVCDREAMIRQFYAGKTHISIKHYNKRLGSYFENTFDLMQNPVTYDIEAFAALWDVTDATLADDIAQKLFAIDYETITAIDAQTGEPRPYVGKHIYDVIASQMAAGGMAAGVEAYLRKYCADDDVDSVIRGTSLPYVKEQLEKRPYYHIAYTLRQGEKLIYKRTMYTYLDNQRTIILCAMQDMTDIHALENTKRDQIEDALQTLHEQTGMNVARYDLRTRVLYSNSKMISDLGYASKVKNVPEEFIGKGLIAPASIDEYRSFFEKFRAGEASTITVACRVKDLSFHWMRISAHLVYGRDNQPYQAILSFRDIEHEREQAAVYKTWRQSIDQRELTDYTLFRCNLTKGIAFDRFEGLLMKRERHRMDLTTFNERVREYAGKYVHIDDFDAYTKLLNSENLLAGYLRGINTASMEFRELACDGEYRWLRLSVELIQHSDMSDVEAFLMYELSDKPEYTETKAETPHKTAFEDTGLTVVKYDCQSGVFTYDPAISQRLLGNWDDRGLWEILLTDAVADAQDVKAMRELVLELAENPVRVSCTMELMLKTPANTAHWFNFFAIKQIGAQSNTANIVMTFLDINDDVLANTQLQFLAEHDSLTGLYNRVAFLRRVKDIARGKPGNSYILLCGDINDFGMFNECFGPEEGDNLLKYCADRLRSYAHARSGFAGRLSGNMFAVILPNSPGAIDEASSFLRGCFDDYQSRVKLTARAGAYIISDPDMTADSMLDMAAAAKEAIRVRHDAWFSVADSRMIDKRLREKRITERMEDALANGEFDVYFQPQFYSDARIIVGAEALVRWSDPERGVIMPEEFIPLFEKNGFIERMDEYVRDKAAQYLSRWLAEGKEPPPISVNASRADMDDSEFVRKLLAIVEKYSIPLPMFRVEIARSLFSRNPEHIAQVVRELHEAGFLVVMDGFGRNGSSLGILRDVPVDVLKLDMQFFFGDDNPGRGGMIVGAVMRMCRWLGLPVVAEGVEIADQADFLASIGCHTIQGFLYEKPMPAEQFAKLLDEGHIMTTVSHYAADTKLNRHDFWNPLSADSQVFNHCIGPAALFEYYNGEYEVLRINRALFEAARTGTDEEQSLLELLDLCEEDIPKFRKAVIEAIYYGKDTKAAVRRLRPDASPLISRVTLRVLAKTAERAQLIATLDE